MTAPKKISMALATLLDDPIVKIILDRSADITPAISEVQSWWGYDLTSRRPSPAYDEYGIFKGTDLDLACFLFSLTGRGAVINIPTYKGHSQKKARKDQVVTSQYNRHGKLINVGANKDFFSFNISIIDENVVGEDTVGDFRTFSLTDRDGSWYDGWREIQFVPTLKENRFITENELWSGNKIFFKNFIHPNRWISVFGKHYIVTKMLIDRLDEEAKALNTDVKRIKATGIDFPEGEGPESKEFDYGATKSVKRAAHEMRVFIPSANFTGKYSPSPETVEGLVNAYNVRKSYVYTIIPKLRFMTRASEYAHFQNPDRFPAWFKNIAWEDNFKIPPRGRTPYQRLKLFQAAVGEHSVSLLKRTFEKADRVAAD